jgi:UDP-N-acetylmuramyl tripeptide synthase
MELIEELIDSRRLTGASMLLSRPGAILETRLPEARKRRLMRRWAEYVEHLYAGLGWLDEELVHRDQGPTQMLAATAPIDALLAATFVLEQALWFALRDPIRPTAAEFAQALDELDSRVVRRVDARLCALVRAAARHDAQLLLGERDLSVGVGADAVVWPDDELPLPEDVNWIQRSARLPVVLVTGTNGKTTTSRLLARMLTEAGHVVGFSCTDYVQVGAQILDRDDYSGPTGARMVLRHPEVTAAVLETARGGLLRRGIQVNSADVAVVTNVAADHLGDGGIHTLEQLAEAKFSLVRGLRPDAPLVVNAEDRHCTRHARRLERPLYWFARKRPPRALLRGKAAAVALLYVESGWVVVEQAEHTRKLLQVAAMPLAFAGSARHNVANALAATAAALALGIADCAIVRALSSFGENYLDNPGRANLFAIDGALVLADYGHNPEGLAAIFRISAALPHRRLLISFGQAGDRSDQDMHDLADQVAAQQPDRILIKDIQSMLRGRQAGEIPTILSRQLQRKSIGASQIEVLDGDRAALDRTLQWLQDGDLAVLFVHADSAEVLAELAQRAQPVET